MTAEEQVAINRQTPMGHPNKAPEWLGDDLVEEAPIEQEKECLPKQ